MKRAVAAAFIAVVAFGSAVVAASCGNSVVGGDCADGYELCSGACVLRGACTPGFDGGDSSILLDGDESDVDDPDGVGRHDSDAGREDVSSTEASDADARSGDGADGDGRIPDGCPAPPFDNVSNCGACGVVCSGDTPVCKPVGSSTDGGVDAATPFACASPCEGTEKLCSGVCVDTDIDPFNCGGCGIFCPTGLCNGGKCRGARTGHMVAIGHDYTSATPTSAVAQVVVNAVFLPSTNPVRVLAYDQYADPVAEANVGKILDAASIKSGRAYVRTVAASADEVLTKLNIDSFDLMLFYDQPKAPAGTLATLGVDLSAKLKSFNETGGVVVVLDGGGGIGEMPKFFTAAGLLGVSSQTTITGKTVDVVAPADAIGIDVLTPYLAPSKSVTFTLSDPPSSTSVVVVQEPTSTGPVVIHRVVRKP